MSTNVVIAIAAGSVGVLQTLIVFILVGIRSNQVAMWKRLNNHYHEVHCDNEECNHLKTGNVILPQGSS
jgi:hypothetical protein